MSAHDDALWSAGDHGDAELARLERLLGRYRHVPEAALAPAVRVRPRPPVRRLAGVALLCVGVVLGSWFGWRLHWRADAPWTVAGASAASERLPVGGSLVTPMDERARVDVARIGTLELSPDTRVTLLETQPGRHRVALESGHVRARIWAPPGWFGVRVDDADILDLGCEFDLWADAGGRGRALVHSGWILHSRAGHDTLVPAGHVLEFDAAHASLPLRERADAAFATAVVRLDLALAGGERDRQAETDVALRATSADVFTLLALLTRHPALADGPLYPRLADMLDAPPDDTRHRQAWAQGSTHAINDWWTLVPRPPKQWWRYWRDAVS